MSIQSTLSVATVACLVATRTLVSQADILQREVVLRANPSSEIKTATNIGYKPGVAGAVMDVYTPARPAGEGGLPVVVFVHGGPVPALPGSIKDIGQYRSYGRLVASRGLAAVTFAFRFPDLGGLSTATADVSDAVAYVRAHAMEYHLDPESSLPLGSVGRWSHRCPAARTRGAVRSLLGLLLYGFERRCLRSARNPGPTRS